VGTAAKSATGRRSGQAGTSGRAATYRPARAWAPEPSAVGGLPKAPASHWLTVPRSRHRSPWERSSRVLRGTYRRSRRPAPEKLPW